MRLNMAQVVFKGERTVAKYAEERISSAPLSRLSHPDVFCQLCDEVGVRVVDDELAFGLATDETVGEDDLALRDICLASIRRFGAHDLLAVHLNTKQDWLKPVSQKLNICFGKFSHKMSDLKSHNFHGESSQNKDFRMVAR